MIPSCYRRTHNDTTHFVLLLVTTSTQVMGSIVASHGMPALLDCTAALPKLPHYINMCTLVKTSTTPLQVWAQTL